MQVDFFQVLRRVQKEERNKSSLSRVENDFYKQLREYIKKLERSVASDPFGNEQLLLNNAQRIATEICELRESKITKAANNNIYRSFLLFKKDNPQFDLLDTTPLNLTDEEEILYFSLMDALKNHRYRISLDEYAEDNTYEEEEEEDLDETDETVFVDDSYNDSIEAESSIDDLEDEISDALGESFAGDEATSSLDEPIQEESSNSIESADVKIDGDDEVLNRLGQIKDAKVVTDEKYEHIDKQVASQKYQSQSNGIVAEEEVQVESSGSIETADESTAMESAELDTQESEETSSKKQESSKTESFVSDNINDLFKDPDSQFVDLDKLEPNYDDDYYNSIAAGSSFAAPSEDDFNMIFAKPKKPKSIESESNESKPDEIKKPIIDAEEKAKVESRESELGFSSGLDVKEGTLDATDGLNKAIQKSNEDNAPKKMIDKTRGGLFTRDEIENTTVVISEDIGEMVGIDGKIYGPFLENDVVILPNITAQILINNNKASLVKL